MIENINNTNAASTPNAVEAVWYIIQSQSAAVRKAIFKRIIDADKEEKKRRQQKMVKDIYILLLTNWLRQNVLDVNYQMLANSSIDIPLWQ